ncbi:hypothetical protein ACFL3G_09120 [Planctomycetota bacterium]
MRNEDDERIIYSINVVDIQEVANQVLKRRLSKEEVALVEESVGGYIDWFQAIENSIWEHITLPQSKIKSSNCVKRT